jgi:hypothetical protein
VIWAVWLDATVATVAVNTPLVWPAAIVTVVGTFTLALLLESATLAPPAGAAADNVIVQLDDPGAVTVPGEQVTDDGTTATVKLIVAACCWPLSVAVTLTLWALITVPAVTLKATLV